MTQGTTKGVPIDTDPTMAADSNQLVPSQAAVVTYVGAKVAAGALPTTATSNLILLSQNSASPIWSSNTYPTDNNQGDLLFGSALHAISTLAKDTNATRYLSNTGTSNNPAWAQVNLANGVTGALTGTNGGTGVNNGASTITLGGSLTTSGAFASTFTMTNTTTVTFPTSGTLATTSQLITWQAVETGNFNATASNGYPVNTTSAAITATLPASPVAGNIIFFTDYAGTFNTNNLYINPNGNKFNGATSIVAVTQKRESIGIVYIDSTQGWIPYDGFNTITPPVMYVATYVVVAGGGGGGGCTSTGGSGGGGGGAGGFLTSTLNLNTGTVYTITVGGSGAGGTNAPTNGTNGTNSVFASVTATGGGGGGAGTGTTGANGSNGGSGGGGGGSVSTNTAGTGGTATPAGQGNNGGNGLADVGDRRTAGGGGGASAVGANATSTVAGKGGDGTSTSISGSPVTYAGGGGGGANTTGTAGGGGAGGGGAGANNATGSNGSVNTGGGGGGAGNGGGRAGGNGGTGIVVISVPTANYSGTTTGSPTVTTSGGNTIMTFNASGTYTA